MRIRRRWGLPVPARTTRRGPLVPIIKLEERADDAVQPDLDPALPRRVEAELSTAEAGEVRKYELDGVAEHVRVLNLELELVLRACARIERVHKRGAARHLRLHYRLDLRDERLGRERLLVRHLKRNALMVQRARVVRGVYRAPDFVPLALRALPLDFLLLQPREHDGQSKRGSVLHRLQDLEPGLPPVDLFDDALVHRLARAAKVRFEAKHGALFRTHGQDLVIEWLKHADCAHERIDVKIVLVTLFLGAMQCLFVKVFLVRHEDGVFAREARMGDPLIVQHGLAHLITPATLDVDFLDDHLSMINTEIKSQGLTSAGKRL